MAAEDDAERRIAGCATSATPAERITCLERHVRELAGSPAPAAADVVKPPAPVQAPAATHAPAPTVAAGEAADAAAPAVSPGPAPAVELGAEQVEARRRGADEPATRVAATAVNFRFIGYERLLVELDNGQVWRQIDGDRVSVERALRNVESFDVEMWATKLGGYRMRILPLNRTIRVERLR